MTYCSRFVFALVLIVVPASSTAMAHHEILAKFDPAKPQTLQGMVTLVDWKNPHVHLLLNVQQGTGTGQWAIELESPIDLERSGWTDDSVKLGDAITVQGIAARDGSRQLWANSISMTNGGARVLNVTAEDLPAPKQVRPAPRWPDGQPRLGPPAGGSGYWAYPSATSLMESVITCTA